MTQAPRIAALDGLRGLAILLVMIVHFAGDAAGTQLLPAFVRSVFYAGWIGVDLFFVLSGFLITGILLQARGSAHYFRNFYMRRVLRIFPLYYGVLFVVFVLVPLVHTYSSVVQPVVNDQEWLWLYAANIKIAIDGVWKFGAGSLELGHFWSLAIEEHFYLVWPALVWFIRPRTLMWVCVLAIPAALILRVQLLAHGMTPTGVYVFTPARIDTLAFGGFLALLVSELGGVTKLLSVARVTLLLSSILIVAVFIRNDGTAEWPPAMQGIGYPLLAICFGSMLILALAPGGDSAIARACSSRTLRILGTYSYGLYVFHVPLRAVFSRVFGIERLNGIVHSPLVATALFATISMAISLAVAVASWHLYEVHFLKLKRFFEYRATSSRDTPALPALSATEPLSIANASEERA
jgi:peptidoglycan/LPS O-acetylase OafA/YrhL